MDNDLQLQKEELEDNDYPDEKSKYIAVLKEAKESDISIRTQKDFQKYYAKKFNGKEPLQSTISDNFRNFGIEKNEDGNYEYFGYTSDKTLAQQYIFSTNCSATSKICNKNTNIFFFRVKTAVGSEQIICKMIDDIYSDKYFAIIPCFGSVIIACKREENAKSIKKFIRDSIGYSFEWQPRINI